MTTTALAARQFRDVIGHYPTGVVVVTGLDAEDRPLGMVIGSFTSASLEPPLVLFLPMKTSRTFRKLRTANAYCINVLAAGQEQLCQHFSSKSGQDDLFDTVEWHAAPSGAPILDGAVAWIDCTPQDLIDCGDHYIAIGAVQNLGVQSATLPLLFFQSGYGRFARRSLMLAAAPELITAVRDAEAIRPQAKQLAAQLQAECCVLAPVDGETVFVAAETKADVPPPPLGMHTPSFPPLAPLFVGSPGAPDDAEWLGLLGGSAPDVVEDAARRLARTRERGWSLMLHSPTHSRDELDQAVADYMAATSTPADERRLVALLSEMSPFHEPEQIDDDERYDVLRIAAPVYDAAGTVVLVLRLAALPPQATGAQVKEWIAQLQQAATAASAQLAAR